MIDAGMVIKDEAIRVTDSELRMMDDDELRLLQRMFSEETTYPNLDIHAYTDYDAGAIANGILVVIKCQVPCITDLSDQVVYHVDTYL